MLSVLVGWSSIVFSFILALFPYVAPLILAVYAGHIREENRRATERIDELEREVASLQARAE